MQEDYEDRWPTGDPDWQRKALLEQQMIEEMERELCQTGTCTVCGEPYNEADPRPSVSHIAEMFDPADETSTSVIVHAECGLNAGLEVA